MSVQSTFNRASKAQGTQPPKKGPLGFDLEWRPNYKKGQAENPVALVQLSNPTTILLIQVSSMQKFPDKLKALLGDPQRIKAGVGIKYDCQKLHKDYGISTLCCVDLSLLARSVDNDRWKGKYTNPLGLSRLLETYESYSLAKGRVSRSNWEANLSPIQQEYAANDAYAGYVIYARLIAMAQAMLHIPSPDCYTFSVVNGMMWDRFGMVEWSPANPLYDPGPPPPPKEPKERKPRDAPKVALSIPTGAQSNPTTIPQRFRPRERGNFTSNPHVSRFTSFGAGVGSSTNHQRYDSAHIEHRRDMTVDPHPDTTSRFNQSNSNHRGRRGRRGYRTPMAAHDNRNPTTT
ncbi:ribonuclease H-like domain-containing protein [Hygrophoropsis aurantiaca]|uniref:Ribonuclease H-like domain-containing protein n=1 Tax=Hygrophoropsis aurantiaca TaxID=72124 RepID=A0ACB8AQP6_9AGAM|nr:ribonuclease H-like domain-containing protein [Hygrophoropsis aurantiaca]